MSFKRLIQIGAALAVLSLASGCAHNIVITPESPAATDAAKSSKAVGLYISAADREKKVETPGGGGDKVSYAPYKDLEGPLYFTLARVYTKVESVPAADAATLSAKGLNFFVTPIIVTDSSSTSSFTWPPTNFSVELQVKAVDGAGKELWAEKVTGKGAAEFAEFKSDFPLAAKRAGKDALDQLEVVLRKREGLK
jgi:hypothetical protein